jgi:hypothetical protein
MGARAWQYAVCQNPILLIGINNCKLKGGKNSRLQAQAELPCLDTL